MLREFLHSIHPSATLQAVFNNNKGKLTKPHSTKKIITRSQWEILFPPSGDPPDSKSFDVTLLHLLLREFCSLTAPSTGWHNLPADSDVSPEANIVRIKYYRNELCHSVSTSITKVEFEDKWKVVSSALVALGLDQKDVDRLKTEPIDHDTERRVEEEVNKCKLEIEPRFESLEEDVLKMKGEMSRIQGSLSDQNISELTDCLPDKVANVFGRSKEIQQVIKPIVTRQVGTVVITGGPGFGKTTVANEVGHELATNPENVVLFCSLKSKATVNDVATSMILTCSKNYFQPPENPQHWLRNWSKQQQQRVTCILDNADDVLESDERAGFASLLQDMRMLAKGNVTFVVTSRKVFKHSSLEMEEVRVTPLSSDEAKKLVESKVDESVRVKLSQTEKLVELCGCVPLALCIVGSLLSDVYTEDELIRRLEEKPMDVLKEDLSDDNSVEKAIKTSFDSLGKSELEALLLLSAFPGSFDSSAAKALITTSSCPEQPQLILRSLKNRSLVEMTAPQRYQVHQLIQAYAKKIDQTKYFEGEKEAYAHFISRLADNANMYWSKDKCKESIEAFNVDRHNFEYFLNFYVNKMEKRDGDCLQSSASRFLDNFPQKCMYLEMCLLPSFYIMILEKLLDQFHSERQPVQKVDLLCLLANEKRKVGNQAQYKVRMKQAQYVYARRYTEFRTNGLSQVHFFNSYARYLKERRLPREQLNKAHEIALILCGKKLHEHHPETAATLLFIGRHQKSLPRLQEALNLFKRSLGEHFMTAQGHKAIADFFFVRGTDMKSDEADKVLYIDKSSEHYKEALTMTEKLGTGGHKESILTLKNYGLCHQEKQDFEGAINFLLKAKRVADIELEDDHKWKVMIETQLALLYDCVGRAEEAREVMKQGLEMNERLERSISQLPNKFDIELFLKRYPDTLL